jgi:hypothetical protein
MPQFEFGARSPADELGLPAQRIYPLLFLRIGNLRAGKMFSRFVIGF